MAATTSSSIALARVDGLYASNLEAKSLASSRASLPSAQRFLVRQSATAVSRRHSVVQCAQKAIHDPPVVADTKAAFLKAYPKPIPSIYNTVIQEILVQQHLTRYNRTYKYDPVLALGFVTVFDQLMDGYPSPAERDAIFKAYVEALNESPKTYRDDAARLEQWAAGLTADDLIDINNRDGDVERSLKDIAERAKAGTFHYSRFFAVGLFRLLEITKSSEPATLQKLCEALGINQMSVNRDLDVYRGLLSKLTQAKELLQDFLQREKARKEEREREKAQKAQAAKE
ncbi:unnamed protein product [Closterium sp. Yama58-4]|nr:unnamed protein product [Closterium sp. Yama58-4]